MAFKIEPTEDLDQTCYGCGRPESVLFITSDKLPGPVPMCRLCSKLLCKSLVRIFIAIEDRDPLITSYDSKLTSKSG